MKQKDAGSESEGEDRRFDLSELVVAPAAWLAQSVTTQSRIDTRDARARAVKWDLECCLA